MKNNENDIIDIPTELKIDGPEDNIEVLDMNPNTENLEVSNNEIESIKLNNEGEQNTLTSINNDKVSITGETTTNAQRIESIDGNPEVLDIEIRNLETPKKPKSRKGLKVLLLIILILLIASGIVFGYYKFVLNNKPVETNKDLKLLVKSLNMASSFEEAYNQKTAEFNTKSTGKGTIYEISNGSIKFVNGETEIYLSIKETSITAVSYLTEFNSNEVIAIKDTLDNYYFAHINTAVKEDIILNYENSQLIKVNNDKDISAISVAKYLNGEELFYIAKKNGQNNFITIENGEVVDISSMNLNVYNGINIDVDDLRINDSVKSKLNINGVGLFYDGALYIYKGDIKDINEIEIKNNGESFDCEKIFVVYNENLEFFDLYVITYDEYLYKINLLTVDIATKKVDIEKYESKISEYTIFENDTNSIDIVFENGETIKLK